MANSSQARKRARQNIKRNLHNTSLTSAMRTAIKSLLKQIQAGSKDAATSAYKRATVLIDRLAGKSIIHTNKAARLKSRLTKRLKAISS